MHGYSQDQIYGSWFPTGYHGHFRSKSRQEFTIPYREKAKPPPPTKFLNRSSARSTDHLFSRHDNRNVHSSTMGDLEMHFSHGLGRRKPNAGAAQRYKDTSALLRWSSEPLFSPASSYQDDFISQSLPQTRITNEMEPVHTRRTYNLKRRQLRQTTKSAPLRTVPLLAWNIPDENTYAKPCVGTDRSFVPPKLSRESNSKLCRESISTTSKSLEKSNNHHDISHVIETVTKLDL